MSEPTGLRDTFVRDHLPPPNEWPDLILDLPGLRYPARLNCAVELLDRLIERGFADKPLIHTAAGCWTYGELLNRVNRIAAALTHDFGLVPGNRVLIRAANNPMFVACWLAVVRAGGIAVATMPLLRARELAVIANKAQVGLALCDERLAAEIEAARADAPVLRRVVGFAADGTTGGELNVAMARRDGAFAPVDTAADDVALIAFTSGTTGMPKGTVHCHRDVLAACDCFPRSVLPPNARDVFICSPPIAFTYGLGGLVLFPMRAGAATVLLEKAPPDALVEAIEAFGATICFTAPTAYRAMLAHLAGHDMATLAKCVSAGESLPLATFEAWRAATGIKIIDGIGSTELLHIFISSSGDDIRPGATGRVVPGYEARVVDAAMRSLPDGEVGRLAARGPTGCRYLADDRQRSYVVQGWNLTGDAYRRDADGYFWYQARTDDMIISAGYNVAGQEVEEVLLEHPAVAECAVVGAPDPERGTIVKAFVVTRPGPAADVGLIHELQEFVKARIAPYKYPRAIEFLTALPRTETGKLQRYVLRERARTTRAD